MTTHKQLWRIAEDNVAAYFNGKRRPQIKYEKQGNDVFTDLLEIEVKTRKRALFPKWIQQALQKLRKQTTSDKIPILILLNPPDLSVEDGEVLIKVKDLKALLLGQQQSGLEPASAPEPPPSRSTVKVKRRSRSRWQRRTFRKR